MIEVQPALRPIEAVVRLPGSKSITNRALVLAALAEGPSTVRGALFSDDTVYMITALSDLGFSVQADEPSQQVTIEGAAGAVPASRSALFCGNAGTTVRFVTALAATGHGEFHIDGNARMRERPIQPLLDALAQLGVKATARFRNGCPPVDITTTGCPGGHVAIDGSQSSQYFSALAMAAPAMVNGIEIEVVGELASKPYLDLTAGVMKAFGVELVNDSYQRITVAPGQRYVGRDYLVEPDASTASYFMAAAAVTGGRVSICGLELESGQGDIGFVRVLEQMGCAIGHDEHGLTISGPEQLHGVTVDMNSMSDVAMTLAAIAPYADSPTEIRNIAFIRRKESDRVAAVATELTRLGVTVTEFDDGWRIEPGQPNGGAVETYDDHRLAMSFSVLGLRAPGTVIRDPECVNKTFPGFFARFGALTAGGLA